MKKFLLTFICIFLSIFLILSESANATDTRAKGMALDSNTRWMVDGLVTYCYNNPSMLYRFGSQVFLELSVDPVTSNVDYLGGIILRPSNKFRLGLFSGFKVGDDGDAFNGNKYVNVVHASAVTPTGLDLTDNYQYFTLMAAFKISRFFMGLKFGWTGESYKQDGGFEEDAHAFVIGIGTFFKIKGRFSMEINPDITIYWIKIFQNVSGDNVYEGDGSMDFILPIRLNYSFSAKSILHIMAGFGYLNRSTKDSNDKWERKGLKFFVGFSNEWRVSNKVLVLLGLNMDYYQKGYKDSSTPKEESSQLLLPFNLGIEGRLPKNWIIRCGLKHNIIEYTVDASVTPEVTTLNSGSIVGALGLGLRIGNLDIDWNVNAEIFVDGPHFISGQSNNFATDFAISYKFGGR